MTLFIYLFIFSKVSERKNPLRYRKILVETSQRSHAHHWKNSQFHIHGEAVGGD